MQSLSLSFLKTLFFRLVFGLPVFLLTVWLVPPRWCGRQAQHFFEDGPAQAALAGQLGQWVDRPLSRSDFFTGSSQFDGEWLFGTYMMAAMGYGQHARTLPEGPERTTCMERMEFCFEKILHPDVRLFDTESWGGDAIASLDDPKAHHAAYLGYFNLALSLHRSLRMESEYAALNDRISAALTERVKQSETRLLQTYPGEVYPVDNCAVIASIGLHARVTGADRSALLADWETQLRTRYLAMGNGLLIQSVHLDGSPLDQPRGSGTSLAIYFLGYSHPDLSRDLYEALRRELHGTFMGFGGIREYPRGGFGFGDIDSGPIAFGFGMSATGFSLAGARMYDDPQLFRRLFSTAWLCGAPIQRRDRVEFVTGGPLGNAILFAMFTAPRGGRS